MSCPKIIDGRPYKSKAELEHQRRSHQGEYRKFAARDRESRRPRWIRSSAPRAASRGGGRRPRREETKENTGSSLPIASFSFGPWRAEPTVSPRAFLLDRGSMLTGAPYTRCSTPGAGGTVRASGSPARRDQRACPASSSPETLTGVPVEERPRFGRARGFAVTPSGDPTS